MNHTTLAIVAVITAATLVIGTLATTAIAPSAFAKTSSKTVTKQKNDQEFSQSGQINIGVQAAINDICTLSPGVCI